METRRPRHQVWEDSKGSRYPQCPASLTAVATSQNGFESSSYKPFHIGSSGHTVSTDAKAFDSRKGEVPMAEGKNYRSWEGGRTPRGSIKSTENIAKSMVPVSEHRFQGSHPLTCFAPGFCSIGVILSIFVSFLNWQ